MDSRCPRFIRRSRLGASLAAGMSVLLAGCAGSAGAGGDVGSADHAGLAFGAGQNEVNEAIEGLEPVTLVYQPEATSPESSGARAAEQFKEEIERRSNGQITIDIVYGQSIAGFEEIDDALKDGRVDIGFNVPVYDPSAYPTFDDVSVFSQYAPASPFLGEMAGAAMFLESAWNSDGLIAEFEDQGLMPLTPMLNGGEFYYWCNSSNTGNSASDWQGRQVRAATQLHQRVVDELGGSPVMLEYVETFEGLQRNTVDCTASQSIGIGPGGVMEVAPNVSYLEEGSFGGRNPSTQVAGADVVALPLPYKQIIFDAEAAFYDGWLHHVMETKVMSVAGAVEAGGTIEALPGDVQDVIAESQQAIAEETVDNGRVPEDSAEFARDTGAKWLGVAEELGYTDSGEFENIHEWYEAEEMDFRPFTDRMFEEISLDHRPE